MVGFALVASKLVIKSKNAIVSSIKINSFYVLTKGTNGVKAKFVGTTMLGPKKKAIWVLKSSVTNCNNLGFPITQKSKLKNFSNKTHAW